MIFKARYVAPVAAPVIENGGVTVHDGRITAVAAAGDLGPGSTVDFGDAVICPGFVNAHTHLDLSLMGELRPTSDDFIAWLKRLVAARRRDPPTRESVRAAVCAGVAESLRAGVTSVGDITATALWTRDVLASSPLRGVSFGEVISLGTRRDQLDSQLDAAASPVVDSSLIRSGISPHAPYTVEPDAMRACGDRARALELPLAIHLAETEAEEIFTTRGTGAFLAYLKGLGVWDDRIPVGGCGPVELAGRVGLLGPGTVIAHANYVTDDDLDRLRDSGASVAYCPRTHHAFAHAPHRFREMLARGINVCAATDSLASNPSLSVLEELRFLHVAHPDLAPETLLAMGTVHGARALGLGGQCGCLRVGYRADLAVVRLDPSRAATGWASVLDGAALPRAVFIAGRQVVDEQGLCPLD